MNESNLNETDVGNILEDKKWFILFKDGYQGPYSTQDLWENKEKLNLTSSSYVWCKGMKEWEKIFCLSELNFLLDFKEVSLVKEIDQENSSLISSKDCKKNDEKVSEKDLTGDKNDRFFTSHTIHSATHPISHWDSLILASRKKDKKTKFILLYSIGFVVLVVFGVLAYNYLNKVPYLSGISREDQERIKQMIRASQTEMGAQALMIRTLPKEGSVNSGFYILMNVDDGVRLKIQVSGIKETLLEYVDIQLAQDAVILDHKAFINPFDTKSKIPVGEYLISVYCTNCPLLEENQVVSSEKYFVGDKNNEYLNALHKLHSSLRVQANMELMEIKQFSDTLQSQLLETNKKFDEFLYMKSNRKIKFWNTFHASWSSFQEQINNMSLSWDMNSHIFYKKLYSWLKQSSELIDSIHKRQNEVMNSGYNGEHEQVQIYEAISTAQSLLLAIRAKVNVLSHRPSVIEGLPPED